MRSQKVLFSNVRRLHFSNISSPTNNNLGSVTHERMSGLKRFYKTVDVTEVVDKPGFYNVRLDGKLLKSPAKSAFDLPNRSIALVIATEWDAQTNPIAGIQPSSMPFMILASTAVDQIIPDSEFVQKTCLSYLPTDTALFFSDETDRVLQKKQKQAFEPLIAWLNSNFDLDVKASYNSFNKIKHSDNTITKVKTLIESMDPFTLSCLQSLTMECKSLVMALGLLYK
jgi:ATP synthase mitochondrial F1 complex assembly factor 2